MWDKWLVWYSHFKVDSLRPGVGVSGALIVILPLSEMSSEAFLLENLTFSQEFPSGTFISFWLLYAKTIMNRFLAHNQDRLLGFPFLR